MPYNNLGVYTPPTGALNAAPGQVIRSATWNSIFGDISDTLTEIGQGVAIEYVIKDGAFPLIVGLKGFLSIPINLSIRSWTLLGDTTGSAVVNVWKSTFAAFPPTVADKITASAPPSISAAKSGHSAVLTGWTTLISAGDVLAFNVDSATSISQVTLLLDCARTG